MPGVLLPTAMCGRQQVSCKFAQRCCCGRHAVPAASQLATFRASAYKLNVQARTCEDTCVNTRYMRQPTDTMLLVFTSAADLAFNVALGATLVALPLTIGAITRSAFVKYKFTDKRVSVVTKAPWESEWLAEHVGQRRFSSHSMICPFNNGSSAQQLTCKTSEHVLGTFWTDRQCLCTARHESVCAPAGCATDCTAAVCYAVLSFRLCRLFVRKTSRPTAPLSSLLVSVV